MMIACEREFLKAHSQFEKLVEHLRRASEEHVRMDQVERTVFAEVLAMGASLLKGFVAAAGDGDHGESLEVPSAAADVSPSAAEASPRTLRRLPEPHTRRYVSIFGELTITRWVYGTREGQKIEAVPLDARRGLPEGEFSYVLEDWQQRLCVKESFSEATGDLAELLGIAPSVRAAEVMNRQMAEFAPSFRIDQPPPPADEEGEEFNGRVSLFGELSDAVAARSQNGRKTVVAVMDGERALWDVLGCFLSSAVGILDIFHVLERLWNAAHVFHAEGSPAAEKFVTDRLRMLLQGQVGGVIGGLRQMLTKHALSGSKRKALATVIGYFDNNRPHMLYDQQFPDSEKRCESGVFADASA